MADWLWRCLECGWVFKSVKAAARAADNGCPKCGGVDVDNALAGGGRAPRPEDRGLATRLADSRAVYAATRDHRAAVRAYCAGNVWLTENAKAVGNW